jgi:hypothetical protein
MMKDISSPRTWRQTATSAERPFCWTHVPPSCSIHRDERRRCADAVSLISRRFRTEQ